MPIPQMITKILFLSHVQAVCQTRSGMPNRNTGGGKPCADPYSNASAAAACQKNTCTACAPLRSVKTVAEKGRRGVTIRISCSGAVRQTRHQAAVLVRASARITSGGGFAGSGASATAGAPAAAMQSPCRAPTTAGATVAAMGVCAAVALDDGVHAAAPPCCCGTGAGSTAGAAVVVSTGLQARTRRRREEF